MKDCKTFESLLYLYRHGELSHEEETVLNQHLESCPQCSAIRKQLSAIDQSLTSHRNEIPQLNPSARTIEFVMQRLDGTPERTPNKGPHGPRLITILQWARPAFALIILALAGLLLAQQSRDVLKLSKLEARLSARARAETSLSVGISPHDLQLLGDRTLRQEMRTLVEHPRSASSFGKAEIEFLQSFLVMFHNDHGMFATLAKRYPNLATINLEDGLDARERKILSSEGKAFLKEFETLLNEGEK